MNTRLKRLPLVLILLVAFAFSQDLESGYQAAEAKLDSGDFDGAEQAFKSLLEIDPTFAPAFIGLAHVSLRKGEMKATQDYLKKAIEADPENQDFRDEFDRLNELNTLMSKGGRAMKNHELDEAYETFALALEKYPNFAEAAYSMGLAKFRQEKFFEAVKLFRKALELYPYHETARVAIKTVAKKFFNDGNTAYRRGDLDGAMESFKKALEIDSTFFQAHYQIGVIQSKLGDKAKAIVHYQKALDINPKFYKGWFAMGLAKSAQNDIDGALEALNTAVDIYPGYEKAYGAMGDIYIQQNDLDKARQVLTIATQVSPTYAKGFAKLGLIDIKEEKWESAVANLTSASELNGKDAMVWFNMATAYNHLGECEKAKKAARTCTELKQRFGGGWYELGVAEWCQGQGNKTAALNALERSRNDRSWRKMAEYELDRINNPQKYQD